MFNQIQLPQTDQKRKLKYVASRANLLQFLRPRNPFLDPISTRLKPVVRNQTQKKCAILN